MLILQPSNRGLTYVVLVESVTQHLENFITYPNLQLSDFYQRLCQMDHGLTYSPLFYSFVLHLLDFSDVQPMAHYQRSINYATVCPAILCFIY